MTKLSVEIKNIDARVCIVPTVNKNTSLIGVGERIKKLREKNKLSQSELARRMSLYISTMSPATINRYEAGKYYPSADSLFALCKVLSVSADFILFGHEELLENKKIEPFKHEELNNWIEAAAPDDLTESEMETMQSLCFENHPGPHIYSIILTMMRAAHPVQTAQVSRITNIKAS